VTVVQKLKDVCEASSETCSSLNLCLGLFSRQEGVCIYCALVPAHFFRIIFLFIFPIVIITVFILAMNQNKHYKVLFEA